MKLLMLFAVFVLQGNAIASSQIAISAETAVPNQAKGREEQSDLWERRHQYMKKHRQMRLEQLKKNLKANQTNEPEISKDSLLKKQRKARKKLLDQFREEISTQESDQQALQNDEINDNE